MRKNRQNILVLIITGLLLCPVIVRAGVSNVDTGTQDYWSSHIPARSIFNSEQNSPVIDTGTIGYWSTSLPSRGIFSITDVSPTPLYTPTPTPVPTATPEGGCGINLVLYLHGYLNETTFTQQTATVNLQFRTVRNVESGVDFNLALDQTGVTGSQSLPGLSANSYYLLIRQKLSGTTYSGDSIPLGSNHFPMISKDAIGFTDGVTTTVNFSDQSSSNFTEVYVSTHPEASSPMIAVGTSGRYWQLGGGDADGNQTINVSDILKWDTLVGFNDSDDRGDPKFSDQGNFNGSDQIEGYDFNVWKKMINEGNTYAPLP